MSIPVAEPSDSPCVALQIGVVIPTVCHCFLVIAHMPAWSARSDTSPVSIELMREAVIVELPNLHRPCESKFSESCSTKPALLTLLALCLRLLIHTTCSRSTHKMEQSLLLSTHGDF